MVFTRYVSYCVLIIHKWTVFGAITNARFSFFWFQNQNLSEKFKSLPSVYYRRRKKTYFSCQSLLRTKWLLFFFSRLVCSLYFINFFRLYLFVFRVEVKYSFIIFFSPFLFCHECVYYYLYFNLRFGSRWNKISFYTSCVSIFETLVRYGRSGLFQKRLVNGGCTF